MGARILVRVIAIFLLVVGVLAAVGGGVLMGFFGPDDTVGTGVHRLSTPTAALSGELNHIHGTSVQIFDIKPFSPTLHVSVTHADKNVFIGIGPAQAVDGYLTGVAIDKITSLNLYPYGLDTERHAGTTRAATPDQQTFWAARASGATPSLTWKVSNGSYRFVLMNADASSSVAADVKASLKIPHLFILGIGILVGGLIGIAIGVILLVVASRMKAREQSVRAQTP